MWHPYFLEIRNFDDHSIETLKKETGELPTPVFPPTPTPEPSGDIDMRGCSFLLGGK